MRVWITSGEAVSEHANLSHKCITVVNGRGQCETPSPKYSTTAIVEFPIKYPDPNLDPLLVDSATGYQ